MLLIEQNAEGLDVEDRISKCEEFLESLDNEAKIYNSQLKI